MKTTTKKLATPNATRIWKFQKSQNAGRNKTGKPL